MIAVHIELFTVCRIISKVLNKANPNMVIPVDKQIHCLASLWINLRAPKSSTEKPSINIAVRRPRMGIGIDVCKPRSSTNASGVKNNCIKRNKKSSDVPIVAIEYSLISLFINDLTVFVSFCKRQEA